MENIGKLNQGKNKDESEQLELRVLPGSFSVC